MKLAEIRAKATSVHNCHESILRSHSVVEKVRELLRKETPPKVILEIIDDLMGAPQSDFDFGAVIQGEAKAEAMEHYCTCPPPWRAYGNDTTPFCDRCNKEIRQPVSEIEAWRRDLSPEHSFDRKVGK